MRRAFLLLLGPSLLLGACCTGFVGQPPGLASHPPPHPRGPSHKAPKPPGGEAIEGKSVEIEGVGHAIIVTSPTPDPEATPTETPDDEDATPAPTVAPPQN